MADFESAIVQTLIHEGGNTVTDDPDDSGGLTKYGISQRSYPEVDIRNLIESEARQIYKDDYWDAIEGDRIVVQAIAESIFDSAVNMGIRPASRLAQAALGFSYRDGIIGDNTLRRLNEADQRVFLDRFALAKIAYYVAICKKKSSQRRFLLGWVSRALKGVI